MTVAVSLPIITLIASIATPTAVGTGLVYYLNNEYAPKIEGGYLSVNEWRLAGAESDARRLKLAIDNLQWDVDNGVATEKDKWLLEQMKQDLRELEGKISKLREGRPTV